MDNIFILQKNLTALNLQDAIDERITKLHAVIRCVWANYDSEIQLDDITLHDALSCCCDILEEIELLREKQAPILQF